MKTFWKLFLFTAIVLNFSNPAFSASIKVVAEILNDFSTQSPTKNVQFKILDNHNLRNGEIIPAGIVFKGEVIEISPAKIGKQDAFFNLKIKQYSLSSTHVFENINNDNFIVKIKDYNEFDLTETSLDVGTSVTGIFVKNIAYPINFARGIIKPYDDKSRLASGFQKTYEESFLSYASKGHDINLNVGDKIVVIFYYKDK